MSSKKIIQTVDAPAAIGPYSQAVLVGNTLYCSGQICIDAKSGDLVNEDIGKETEQVMKNIGAVLRAAEMDFSHVVKATIYMTDMANYGEINRVYATFFGEDPPAREAVEVSVLPKKVSVEISVVAVK